MANQEALFIGWGQIARGREVGALTVFRDTQNYWQERKDAGEVDDYATYMLEAHGGDLTGFILVRGDREQLAKLRTSDEFLHIADRARAVVDMRAIAPAYTGDELDRFVSRIQQVADEFGTTTPVG